MSTTDDSSNVPGPTDSDAAPVDCAICLEPCVFPVELPCHHTFCYLCVKGTAVQATHQGQKPRCSMCRAEIPLHILINPPLKDSSALYKTIPTDEFQWYYQSRSGGWWQFEERARNDLEVAFDAKEPICKLLIAGQIFEVDLVQMIQYRPNNRNAFRTIKRDLSSSTQTKGIAGIRIISGISAGQSSTVPGSVTIGTDDGSQQLQGDGGDSGNGGAAPGTISLVSASALVPPSTIREIGAGNLRGDADDDDLDLGQVLVFDLMSNSSDGDGSYYLGSDYDDDEFGMESEDEGEAGLNSGEDDELGTPSDDAVPASNNPSVDPSNSSVPLSGSQLPIPSVPSNDGGPPASLPITSSGGDQEIAYAAEMEMDPLTPVLIVIESSEEDMEVDGE